MVPSVLLVLALCGADSKTTDLVLRDHAVVAELNHFYDDQGRHVFDQILYKKPPYPGTECHIFAWRLIKDGRQDDPEERARWNAEQERLNPKKLHECLPYVPKWVGSPMVPTWNYQRGVYVSLYWDKDDLREVTAEVLVESWTQFDPELVDREVFKKELRSELTQKKKAEPPQPAKSAKAMSDEGKFFEKNFYMKFLDIFTRRPNGLP